MGTLVITQHVTLDGAIEMLDDWFDPTDQENRTSSSPAASRCVTR